MWLSVVSPWGPTPLTLIMVVMDGGYGEDVEALDILSTSTTAVLTPSRRVPLAGNPLLRPLVCWGHPRTSPCRGPQLELPGGVVVGSATVVGTTSVHTSSVPMLASSVLIVVVMVPSIISSIPAAVHVRAVVVSIVPHVVGSVVTASMVP
jgi:hypothetical protein